MKAFASNGYKLATASRNLRLVLVLFLLFTLLGYATNVLLTYRQTGYSVQGIVSYYRGSQDAAGEIISYPKSVAELLMNTHFHLFMMPLTLLVLCHIFYMMSVPDRIKRWVTWLSFGAVFVEIAGPWGVRFVSAGLAPVLLLGNLVLAVTLGILIVAPLLEVWLGPRGAAPRAGGPVPPG